MSYPKILHYFGSSVYDYLFLFKLFLDTLIRSVQVKIFDPSSDSFSQLLLVLMFTNMVTESKKSVHFKYVISACCFSTCGSVTYSASICLSQCRHLCLTPSICLPWRIIVVNVSLTLPLSFSDFFIFRPPSPLMVFEISVCK